MGVKGLWQLLEPTGKAVSPESLSGKILAVDISMWLHQLSKGMRDSQGNPVPNAHLIGLFKRLCKLLYFGIKPVFVFDGVVPTLKKQTIALRQKKREDASASSKIYARKLLTKLLQKHALFNITGVHEETEVISAGRVKKKKEIDYDIFKLPPAAPSYQNQENDGSNDEHEASKRSQQQEENMELNFMAMAGTEVDFDSEDFKNLPPSVKLELLMEHRERNKHTPWENICLFPKNSDDFSGYQIQRLMSSNKISRHIDSVRKDANEAMNRDQDDQDFDCEHAISVCRIASRDDIRFVFGKRKNRDFNSMGIPLEKKKFGFEDLTKSKDVLSLEKKPPPFCLTDVTIGGESSGFWGVKNPMEEKFAMVPKVKKEVEERVKSLICSGLVADGRNDRNEKEEEEFTGVKSHDEVLDRDDSDEDQDFIEVSYPEKVSCIETIESKVLKDSIRSDKFITPDLLDCEEIQKITFGGLTEQFCQKTEIESLENFQKKCDTHNVINIIKEGNDKSIGNIHVKLNSDHKDVLDMARDGVELSSEMLSQGVDSQGDKNNTMTPVNETVEITNWDGGSDKEVVENDYNDDEDEEGEKEIKENVKGLIKEVLESCRTTSQGSEPDLESVKEKLADEVVKLRSEIGKQERLITSITEQMQAEAQDLLRLFGVPFLVSPAEAEAQCAFLDRNRLTDGTVTDDSDVFLFGSTRVFRNLFDRDDVTEIYTSENIERRLMLNQSGLVCIGMLCGSDYTSGIRGVGPVTAMEIIHEFKGSDLECLTKFRDWWIAARKQKMPPGNETKVKSKLRQFHLFEGFPSQAVYDAYLRPTVDESMEPFQWGKPNLALLEEYAIKTLNWTKQQMNDMITPLANKLMKNESQKQVTDYFEVGSQISSSSTGKRIKSQRLKRIVNMKNYENNKEKEKEEKMKNSSSSKQRLSKREKMPAATAKNKGKTPASKKPTLIQNEVNLSEDSNDDDDEIEDSVLASLDIENEIRKAANRAEIGGGSRCNK